MTNTKMLITGATDGIGRQTAMELAQKGYALVVHGRSAEKVADLQKTLKAQTGNEQIAGITADFNSLQEIDRMVSELKESHPDLNVLLNNAGVFQKKQEKTADGFEKTFGINHLAVFKLTLSLIDVLKANQPSRIVTVASMAHQWGTMDFSNLNAGQSFDAHDAYSNSKLCNVLFTFKLAEKLEGTEITSNCLHPGVIGTKLLRAGWGGGLPIEEGAKTPVYLATAPELAQVSGKYFVNKAEAQSNPIAHDKELQDKLWQKSLEMTGMKDPLA